MRTIMASIMAICLIVPSWRVLHSEPFSTCTVERQTYLEQQGYTKDQVERVCRDDGAGEAFLGVSGEEPPHGTTQALGEIRNKDGETSPIASGANRCQTNYGTCSLADGALGSRCYCEFWGYTFTGISR
jgi:hypothetical protein